MDVGIARLHAELSVFPPIVLRRIADPSALVAYVSRAMSGPGRHYHNVEHVSEMLVALADCVRFGEVPVSVLPEFIAAVLFHDIVYSPGRCDNEERSAEMFSEVGPSFFVGIDRGLVVRLIRATAHHSALPGSWGPAEKVFLDLDCSILGACHDRYRSYADGVRQEYLTAVSPSDYVAGRKRFLEALLRRPRIFLTGGMQRRLGAQARTNIGWELATLATDCDASHSS